MRGGRRPFRSRSGQTCQVVFKLTPSAWAVRAVSLPKCASVFRSIACGLWSNRVPTANAGE